VATTVPATWANFIVFSSLAKKGYRPPSGETREIGGGRGKKRVQGSGFRKDLPDGRQVRGFTM